MTAAATAADEIQSRLIYAIAYHYLLRVQSELLPLQRASAAIVPPGCDDWHSYVVFGADRAGNKTATIHLRKRKNNPEPSACRNPPDRDLRRVRSAFGRTDDQAVRVFDDHPNLLLRRLRDHATIAGVPAGLPVGWHGFRRGRANDLLADGTSISVILAAGGWKSPAILAYLMIDELHRRVAGIHTIEQSDSD